MRSNADAVPPTPAWRMICHHAVPAGNCRPFRLSRISVSSDGSPGVRLRKRQRAKQTK